jgi:serine protease AprX
MNRNSRTRIGSGRWWAMCLLAVLVFAPLAVGRSTPVQAARNAQPQLLAMAAEQPGAMIDVIVQKTAAGSGVEQTVAALGGTVGRDFSIINAFEATLSAGAAAELAQADGVKWVSLDSAMVDTQTGTTPTTIPDWYYLYNNPMPATGNTAAQAVLPMSATAPGPLTLYNYDTNRDGKPGLLIKKGKEGLQTTDPAKIQTWRLEGFPTDVALTADVQLRLFAAMKDYKQDKTGIVHAYLIARAGPTTQTIATATVTQQSRTWQRYWTPLAFTFAGTAGKVIPAGHQLELVITVDDASGDDMWFAYGTSAYNSALTLNGVQHIEENAVPLAMRPTANCTAAHCVSTTNLQNTYITAINADRVWNEPPYRRGDGVTVAIIDSGVQDYDDIKKHLDGRDRIRATRWTTDDSSGVDDLYGHGSHVAGIIGGNGRLSNGTFIGVAPRVDFVNVKIGDKPGTTVTLADAVASLQWVFDNKDDYNIRVVNLSLTSSVPESYLTNPLNAAVELLWFRGIVVVVAAGNNGQTAGGVVYPPANDPFVITVGATNDNRTGPIQDDIVMPFSAYGTTPDGIVKPDIVAPGMNLVSLIGKSDAVLMRTRSANLVTAPGESSPKYFRMSGTSMSSPVVAGAVALLLQDEPNLTPDQVKYRLMATAAKTDKWPAYNPAQAGAGYLDIHAAVHGTSTESANTGRQINNLLFTGTTPIQFDSVNWGSVNWGASDVSWDQGSSLTAGTTNSIAGTNINWGDAHTNVNWGESRSRANVNWGDAGGSANVNWGDARTNSISWGDASNVNWGESATTDNNRHDVNWGD